MTGEPEQANLRDSTGPFKYGEQGGLGKTKPYIAEVVVVEGKDDVSAVKRACHAQIIITNGLGISREIISEIRSAKERCGVIILTDPDSPGEKIRHIINKAIPGCRQAYIYQNKSAKTTESKLPNLIGVEYASPAEIVQALLEAKASKSTEELPPRYSMSDLINFGLVGGQSSQTTRDRVARKLGLGKPNAKQFLNRLNAYGISKDELLFALQESQE